MNPIDRVLVMGAGPGGAAAAAALTLRGYEVSIFNRSEERIAPMKRRGGIEVEGDMGEQFVPIANITSDVESAIADAQLILIAVPAYGQRTMAEYCLPYLRDGHILLLLTGSSGSLEIGSLFSDAGISLDDVLLGETITLPHSGRMVGEAKVRIKSSFTLRAAAFPARNTDRLFEAVGETLSLRKKPNVLDPGLNNPNFLIHPGPMVVNHAAIERAEGRFSLMNEGMTAGALRLLDGVDEEKMALQQALGNEVVSIDQIYRESGSGPHVYREKGEPFGLRDQIWDRYITEDVPYGTVMFASLGRLLGVATPICDAINTVLSTVEQADFSGQGRTVERLGIAGMSRDELLSYLESGERRIN